MSAALVRKSLALVDPEICGIKVNKKRKKSKATDNFVPESHRLFEKIKEDGRKAKKVDLLRTTAKTSIVDIRKSHKPRSEVLKDNLAKLELIRKICTVELDQNVTRSLIQRAVTRKPVEIKNRGKKSQKKTAFTEDDFKKFEDEYFDE